MIKDKVVIITGASSPGTFGRPEWLQREVAAMDEAAFRPVSLKLSYALSFPFAPAGTVPAAG